MADLSPAAQAIDDAAHQAWVTRDDPRSIAAAALRAAVDQVVPEEYAPLLMRGPDLERLAQRQHSRAQLLAIATELDPPPSDHH